MFYIRQVFCKHELQFIEGHVEYAGYKEGLKIYCYCNKCGFHKSWWKYF